MDMMANFFDVAPHLESDVKSFRLSDSYDVSRKMELEFWKTQEHVLCEQSELAQKRVLTLLDSYTDEDTDIYVVTSRDSIYYEATKKWLDFYDFPYKKLFCIGKNSKFNLIENLEIEAAFEDNPDFFWQWWESDYYKTLDTYCIDYEYNKNVPCTHRIDRKDGLQLEGVLVLK